MTNTVLCSSRIGSAPLQNLDMQYYLCEMTIFIQSFCSHQKAILFSAVLMVTRYSPKHCWSTALCSDSHREHNLTWSTAAAPIQFHQHKRSTNTYTQSIEARKTLLQTTGMVFWLWIVSTSIFIRYRIWQDVDSYFYKEYGFNEYFIIFNSIYL